MVGAWGVFAGLGTQPARIAPALIYIGADFAEGVILVARLTVAAVVAGEVVTDLTHRTTMCPHLTLVDVDTLGSIRAGVVAVAARDALLLACVGAHSVDAVEGRAAGLPQAAALVYVYTVAVGVLREAADALLFVITAERAGCVLADEAHTAVMGLQNAFINVLANIVPQLVACRTCGLPLAYE